MIIAYTGKTGSGKTFRMIKKAYSRWLKGEDIYSNTILFFDNFGGKAGKERTDILYKTLKLFFKKLNWKRGRIIYFEDILEIIEVKDGVILFDEAQVLFSSRQWENLPIEFQYKLQQHRKHRLDLYCTTQNMGAIDIVYRRLVQYWYPCEKIIPIGTYNSFFGLFMIRTKDVDMLYNSVDDLVVENIRSRPFIIHFFTKRLFDTFYDIGFKRFKTIWQTYFTSDLKMKTRWIIMPKNLTLKNVLREMSSLKFRLNPKTYSYSRRT